MQLSPEELDVLDRHRPRIAHRWSEPRGRVGIHAVVDHGATPAVGEVCMARSVEPAAVFDEACRLARSASIRAGLLGVARGGAAVVVVPDPALDREVCLQLLRERLAATPVRVLLGSGLHDVGERLGASVHHDPEGLARLRGRVLEACLSAVPRLASATTALVLGAEPRGRDLAAALRGRGVAVSLWDRDPAAARAVAEPLGVPVLEGAWVEADVDLLVPCEPEPVIDEGVAERLVARAVCGGAPRVLTTARARAILEGRDRWCVPEVLAATAEPLALLAGEGPDAEAQAHAMLERVAQAAQALLTEPRGAHERAIELAVTRSKAAAATAG